LLFNPIWRINYAKNLQGFLTCHVIETVASLDKPLDQLQKITEKDLLGIYRDSLKTMGLPMFNSGALQD